jgi:hypothetical protein
LPFGKQAEEERKRDALLCERYQSLPKVVYFRNMKKIPGSNLGFEREIIQKLGFAQNQPHAS